MCWKCKNPLNVTAPVSRSAVCEKCGADVRCCKNCRYYSPGAHYDCHETVDEPVHDKERANFCAYFKLNTQTGEKTASSAENHQKKFNSLFGD